MPPPLPLSTTSVPVPSNSGFTLAAWIPPSTWSLGCGCRTTRPNRRGRSGRCDAARSGQFGRNGVVSGLGPTGRVLQRLRSERLILLSRLLCVVLQVTRCRDFKASKRSMQQYVGAPQMPQVAAHASAKTHARPDRAMASRYITNGPML